MEWNPWFNSLTNTDTRTIQSQGRGVIAGDEKTINSQVETELGNLKEKYPNGMTRVQLHDEKINYSKNGGFSPTNDPSVNNRAISNRIISQKLATAVEQQTPNLPIHDANASLKPYYATADYLDALNGKVAPVSMLHGLIKLAPRFIAAKLASHLGGGDVISAFGGYQLGKTFEKYMENILNPMRADYLRNLEISHPAPLRQMMESLNQDNAMRGSQLRLPPGSPLGSPNNPIIPPAPTTYEPAAQQIGPMTGTEISPGTQI